MIYRKVQETIFTIQDDITGSAHSMMQLLAEILRRQSERRSRDLSPPPLTMGDEEDEEAEESPTPDPSPSPAGGRLSERVPRLFPFLSHPSTQVRRAAVRALEVLTSQRQLAQDFLPAVAKPLASLLFTVIANLNTIRKDVFRL